MMSEKVNKTKEISKTPIDKGGVKKGVQERNPQKLAAKGRIDRGLYLEWVSIPNMVRLLPDTELKKMGYPVEDVVFSKLIQCKTKGDFCRTFNISQNMPAKWEKEPTFFAEMDKLTQNNHVMRFKKEVDFSFTQKVIRHGDAHRMKLWKQLNEGWSERQEHVNVNMNLTPADLVRQIEERNAKIREAA